MSVHSFNLRQRQWVKLSNCASCIGSLERASGELWTWTYSSDTSALPEVETLIGRSADKALEDFPALVNCRSTLVQSMVKALEMDSKWIPLYNTTGQLEVPSVPGLEPELEPVISKTKKVLSWFMVKRVTDRGSSCSQIIKSSRRMTTTHGEKSSSLSTFRR